MPLDDAALEWLVVNYPACDEFVNRAKHSLAILFSTIKYYLGFRFRW